MTQVAAPPERAGDVGEEPYLVLGRPIEDRSFEAVEAGLGMVLGLAAGSVAGPAGIAVGGAVGAAIGVAAGEALERVVGRAATTTDAVDTDWPTRDE